MTELNNEDTIGIIKADQNDIIAIFSDIEEAKEFLGNASEVCNYRLEIYQHTNTIKTFVIH